jgi:uncharacterized Zn finger protein (UPF0148 family)
LANTPPQLLPFGVDKHSRSKKLSRVTDAYVGPKKKKYKAIKWLLEHKGAMAQKGDPAAFARRVLQDGPDGLAAAMGWSRSTFTKNWMMFSSPGACPKCGSVKIKMLEDWQMVCENCGPLPAAWDEARRIEQSDLMKEIAKSHPRWNLRKRRNEAQRQVATQRRVRKHVASLFTRNAGWSEANSYAEAMPDELRPKIEHQEDPGFEAGVMARQFGADLFDRDAYKKMGVPTNGFDMSVGWNYDPNLPYAQKCSCQLGQKRFGFQKVCPRCEGRGFVTAGSMPYICRIYYSRS